MTVEERGGLGLLLALSSAGCLGLPRYVEDDVGDGDGDGDDDDDDDDDGVTTQAVDEGPSPEGPEGPAPTSVADDAESFLFMPDIGPGTTPTTVADESDVTTDPPPPPDACLAYSALITECYGSDTGEYALDYCVDYRTNLEQYQPECIPVLDEFLVCISALSCRELQTGMACEAERLELDECRNG